ncbi:HD domain-containing phosphohydrolase [Thermosyntropha sp.]|uniref:HD-GYP domain-containing protein n=1 Tax=Thermosyntropha sp. TaxID=2740820 RepID=UPI0025FD3899|nr:HD domain-containing phosphohydrolase [Thermosyntropha sp.]MBO8157934.1 HD domain-containing protein [Thermosyntropha sp.]
MKTRKIVFAGAVVTTLLVQLAVAYELSVFIWAGIILFGGLVTTYYIALNSKSSQEIAALRILLRAYKDLISLNQAENVRYIFDKWLLQLADCEQMFYYSRREELSDLNIEFLYSEYEERIKEGQGFVINNRKELKKVNKNGRIHSLLVLPLPKEEKISDFICFVNSSKGYFSSHDVQVLKCWVDETGRHEKYLKIREVEQEFYHNLLGILMLALEKGTPVFEGHGKRVQKISLLLGQKLGLDEEEMKVLSWAALFHDIGRNISEEGEEIDLHPVYGAELFPDEGILGEVKKAILYHHERYNGSGFPEGLEYDDIPFVSRIIAVADVYDAVVYINREGEEVNHDLGMAVIKKATGTLFDPLVVRALEEIEDDMKRFEEDEIEE